VNPFQIALIQLVIAWLFIGVLAFTCVITCLSLINVVRFADKKQQRWLFRILIVELVAGTVSMFLGYINPSVGDAQKKIQAPLLKKQEELKAKVETLEVDNAELNKTKEALDTEKASLVDQCRHLIEDKDNSVAFNRDLAAMLGELTGEPPRDYQPGGVDMHITLPTPFDRLSIRKTAERLLDKVSIRQAYDIAKRVNGFVSAGSDPKKVIIQTLEDPNITETRALGILQLLCNSVNPIQRQQDNKAAPLH
jgi:hypothetical protein